MLRILMVGMNAEGLAAFSSALEHYDDVDVIHTPSGDDGLSFVTTSEVDLVVAHETLLDMSGLDFIQKLIQRNPMVNSAVISALTEQQYHEATEGMGLMMQLPPIPGPQEAKELVARLKEIMALSFLP